MNPKDISEEPQFNIGDLVAYIYSDISKTHPRVGLVIAYFKVEYDVPEETAFLDYFYEYDILWIGEKYSSVMFEMFLEKYQHDK